MNESLLMRKIMVALSNAGARVFRNNRALAWAGKVIRPSQFMNVTVGPADVVILGARPIHVGLCEGSSDLIGWRTIKITPDMVGLSVAIFSAVEVKTNSGRLSSEQRNFIDAVNSAGGIGVVAHSLDEAVKGICGPTEAS